MVAKPLSQKKRMRIAHVITGLGDGGAEGALYRLINADKENAHQVISLTGTGKYGPLLVEAGVRVDALGLPRGRITSSGMWRLWDVIKASSPDVVQTWMYHADLIGGIVAKLLGRRAIVWGIRNSSIDPRLISRSTRIVARMCAWASGSIPLRIVSCSSRAADVHIQLGYDRRKLVIIPNGYDMSCMAPDQELRTKVRTEWGVGNRTTVLGMVARWDPQKDHRTLIGGLRAFNRRAQASWRFVLIGSGMVGSNAELVELLEEAGIAEKVVLLGARRDIAAVMNALDLHVLSSASEGFPNVVAEAMACGTPCVVTDVGDAALIVGTTGWVVPARDPEQLAKGIESAVAAMRDGDAWFARQQAARAQIADKFGIDRMVRAYAEVWRSTMRADEAR